MFMSKLHNVEENVYGRQIVTDFPRRIGLCVYVTGVRYDPEDGAYFLVRWKTHCAEMGKISPPQVVRVSSEILTIPYNKSFVGPVYLTDSMKQEVAQSVLLAIRSKCNGGELSITLSSRALVDPSSSADASMTWYISSGSFQSSPEVEKTHEAVAA